MTLVMRKRHFRAVCCGLLMGAMIGAADLPAEEPGQGVAVLQDGRTIQGKIHEVPGGYRVDHAGGHFILPYSEVSLTSASLVGAYQAYRDSIRQPSADSHITLAEWCISNNLLSQARDEIEAALRLEPMRTEARALLDQVDQLIRAYAGVPSSPNATTATVQPASAIQIDRFDSSQERTSAGLSRETHQEFIAHVQPLLINKCANAKCHGPAGSTRFTLIGTRLGSSNHRLASEKNLETLFSWIDATKPRQSPLLTKPGEPTKVHQQLFLGERQHQQSLILENWVAQVVREKGKELGSAVSPADPSPIAGTFPGSQPVQLASEQRPEPPMAPAPATPAAQGTPGFLDRIRRESQPDAFDPNLFNRQMHALPAAGANPPSVR